MRSRISSKLIFCKLCEILGCCVPASPVIVVRKVRVYLMFHDGAVATVDIMAAIEEQAGKDLDGALACTLKEQAEAGNPAVPAAVKEQTEEFMLELMKRASINFSVCSVTAVGMATLSASVCSF